MTIRNSVTLIGNVGQQPVCRTLSTGSRMIEFSLATNETYRNRDGEKVQRTEWHKVKAFGKVVDVLERYVNRGTKLVVTGSLRYNKWVDKHEQNRTTAEIFLEEFSFLDSRSNSDDYAVDQPEQNMMVAEPAPERTTKRRAKKSTAKARKQAAATPVEDLPF